MSFLRRSGVWIISWSALGLAVAAQNHLSATQRAQPIAWSLALTDSLATWWLFGLLAWPATRLARTFHLGGPGWRSRLTLHVVGSAVFSLLWILLRALTENWIGPLRGSGRTFSEVLRYAFVATFFFNILVYWVIITCSHALAYHRGLRERELRVVELERRLTSARLQALQMQLNPHFLFNALNGISTLMYRDVDAADSMLIKLSNLLRLALDRGDRQLVPLRDELAFLDSYLDLEQMRFGDRLEVRREIDPATLAANVPNLILQPLVENAIKHGLEPNNRTGIIRLCSSREKGQLVLHVEDNGRGLTRDEATAEGVGTRNCRQRLQQLYGRLGTLSLVPGTNGGVKATLSFPFQENMDGISP